MAPTDSTYQKTWCRAILCHHKVIGHKDIDMKSLESPMTLTQCVTSTLNHKSNGANGFPVPKNLGVEPLFVFYKRE